MESPNSKRRTEFIINWLQDENMSDVDVPQDNDDDISDGLSEKADENTDTEQSADDDENQILEEVMDFEIPNPTETPENEERCDDNPTRTSNTQMQVKSPSFYVGKDQLTKWHVHKLQGQQNKKTRRENIITKLPGVKAMAKNKITIVDCWKIFFSDESISQIVVYTNKQLATANKPLIKTSYSRGIRDCPPTDLDELMAFFSVLYMLGVKKANHANTHEMCATDGTASDFFRAVMSEKRFHQLEP